MSSERASQSSHPAQASERDGSGRGRYILTVTAPRPSAPKGASRDAFEARVLYLLDQGVWPIASEDPLTLDLAPGDRILFVTWEREAAHIVGAARVAGRPEPLTPEQARELAVYCRAQGEEAGAARLRLGVRLAEVDVWRQPVPVAAVQEWLPRQLVHAVSADTPPPAIVRLTDSQYAAVTGATEPKRETTPTPIESRVAGGDVVPQTIVVPHAGDIANGDPLLRFLLTHWNAVDLSDEMDVTERITVRGPQGPLTGAVCRRRETGDLTVMLSAESGAGGELVGRLLSEIGRLRAGGQREVSGIIVSSAPSDELRLAAEAAGCIEVTSLRLRLRASRQVDDGADERLRRAVEGLGSWCAEAAVSSALRDGVSASGYLRVDSPLWQRARAVASAVDDRLPGASGHSLRVSKLVRAVAEDLGLGGDACAYIELAGLLHDVGMLVVPDAVAEKRATLTPEEFGVVQRHADAGARLVQQFGVLSPIALGVRHHHERWDGRGYPARLLGDAIPLLARMVSVAEGFDAMTSVRPYRPAMDRDVALQTITTESGRQWDAGLLHAISHAVNRVASTSPTGSG